MLFLFFKWRKNKVISTADVVVFLCLFSGGVVMLSAPAIWWRAESTGALSSDGIFVRLLNFAVSDPFPLLLLPFVALKRKKTPEESFLSILSYLTFFLFLQCFPSGQGTCAHFYFNLTLMLALVACYRDSMNTISRVFLSVILSFVAAYKCCSAYRSLEEWCFISDAMLKEKASVVRIDCVSDNHEPPGVGAFHDLPYPTLLSDIMSFVYKTPTKQIVFNTYIRDRSAYPSPVEPAETEVFESEGYVVVRLPKGYAPLKSVTMERPGETKRLPRYAEALVFARVIWRSIMRKPALPAFGTDYDNGFHYVVLPPDARNWDSCRIDVYDAVSLDKGRLDVPLRREM